MCFSYYKLNEMKNIFVSWLRISRVGRSLDFTLHGDQIKGATSVVEEDQFEE